MADISAMNSSSSIAQRTRARKFQDHLQKVEKMYGSSSKKRTNNSGKATTISQMNKNSNKKKRKSNEMMSPMAGRTTIHEKKRRIDKKMNIGLTSCAEEDEDDVKILGEIYVGGGTKQVEDDVHEEKTDDVIYIDDTSSNEDEVEENDTRNSGFDEKNNPKISMTKAGSSSFPKEDDDVVILGEEKVNDPMIFKGRLGKERNTIAIDKGSGKDPRSSNNTAEPSSFSEERGLDGKYRSLRATAEGIDKYVSEQGAESIGQEDDSTDSSSTENDDSSDEDFEMDNNKSSSDVDSLSSSAEETDEDYSPDEFGEKKRKEKKTDQRTASQCVNKRRSSKNEDKGKSTGRHNDSVYKRGGSKHGGKDESFDRNKLKKMETSGGSSQKRGFIGQEPSNEVSATKVILQAGEAENENPCNNGVDETVSLKEEISKKGGDLLESTPIKPLHTEEDRKGKTANRSCSLRQKTFPTASISSAECTKLCRESCAVTHKVDIVDTQISGSKVTAGKDEANESSHAKKATNKPNPGAQVEESVTKRRNALFSRQQSHSSTSLDGWRYNGPSRNLSEKQSEEKVCSKVEESAWFAKTRQVHEKKDLDFFKVLANAILGEDDVHRDEPSQQEAKPSSSLGYSLPLKFRFEDEEPTVQEKSDPENNMVAGLFAELENNWIHESLDTFDFTKVDHKTAKASRSEANQINSCGEGKHVLIRYEQIGDICCRCHRVVHEIRDMLPDFAKYATRHSRKSFLEKEDFLVPDDLYISTTMENLKNSCNKTDGTAWSIIPGVRESMYKHQQDGFEFLWKNLAGTTDLAELKNTDPKDVGGCIISHAPGTGKTRLSIVFIQSYLRLFPDSRPVIIAPASMLLTWEEEFKKWEVEFPFHNLCNPEFSGRESRDLLKLFTMSRFQDNNKVRWVKIFSWRKDKSILGISYNLYEKLAGEKVAADEESENLRRILLELPKLVVLDEGHIPRNQSSSIWRTLLKLQTEKRIILSGTPFQNSFDELFNTLHLVRPGILEKEKAFAGMVSSRRRYSRKQRADKECSIHDSRTKEVDKGIEKLKCIMQPFVHVHKGSILQKNLPGLTDCVILLDPQTLQKSLIEKLEFSENSFELGYKVALLSVHPSLAEHCWSSEFENSEVNQDMLRELRLNSVVGAKTKFIMALIQFSTAMNEKVLIFSQYIYPLELIKDQLKANFDWLEGKEILQMQGRLDQLHRQSIIGIFNNPNSEAKVLLAATKCCSEGISLVGASRVVLLDVVWNPSVERQAISRAYRLGQKKVVYTYHLITAGTNEGDKYCRQAEKDRLSQLVFFSAPKENDERRVPTTTFEDRVLEKMVSHVDLKDMFLKIISKPKEADLVETFGLISPA